MYKKGNVLFNDALNTFYLRLYGVGENVQIRSITASFRLRVKRAVGGDTVFTY